MLAMKLVIAAAVVYILLKGTNVLSYTIIKKSVLNSRVWDLNICCGGTDGGGINADIEKHKDLPNFILTKDIYNLPFANNQFENVLVSHTLEHIDDPRGFMDELERVGRKVTILLPPLWDLTAAFNFLEHKWLFFTMKSKVTELPKYVKLPLSGWCHKKYGQRIKA